MGLSTGIGMGIQFSRGGSQSWESYLTALNRSGYNLTGDGLTAKILPTISREDGTISALVANKYRLTPSQNFLDIGATDFSMFGWIYGSVIGNAVTYLGKAATGLPPNPATQGGKYGLRSLYASGIRKIACYIVSDSGYYPIISDIIFDTAGWFHFLMEIDQTNHKFRFFVNGAQIGADVDIAGNFPAVAATTYFEFGFGSWHCQGYNIGVAHRLLSAQEKLDSIGKKTITNTAAFYPLNANTSYAYDVSGNGLHLESTPTKAYGRTIFYTHENHGSLHCFDHGYSVWKNADEDEFIVPNLDTGAILDLSATLTLIKYVEGSATTHNLADSILEFDADIFDKSITGEIAQSVRDALLFYNDSDASTKKRWHISELNRDFIDFSFSKNYKNIVYPQITNNSYNDRLSNLRMRVYNSNLSEANHATVLTQIGDSGLNYQKLRSGVCLAFDDVSRSGSWVKYFKYLYDKYQFHSSIAINIGSTVGEFRNYRHDSWQCIKYGSEIMNHSTTHNDWVAYLATPHTYEELYNSEIVPCQTELTTYGYYAPSVPAIWQVAGFDEGWFNYLLTNGFDYVRAVADGMPANLADACYDGTKQYALGIMHTVALFSDNQAGDDLLLSLVDYAKTNDVIMHIIFHTIGTVNSDGSLQVSITRLEKLIKYVYDNNMTFYRASEMKPSLFS